MAKPIKTLELHHPMIQFLIKWLNSSLHSHSHQTVRLRVWKWAVHSGKGRFSILHPLTSSSYCLESKLLHVIRGRILPFLVPRLARSNRRKRNDDSSGKSKQRNVNAGATRWRIEAKKWHKETTKQRNDKSNILSTIWLHMYSSCMTRCFTWLVYFY